jgi:hypothetical protein
MEEGDDILMMMAIAPGFLTEKLSFLKVNNSNGWLEFINVIEQATGRFGYTDFDNRLHNTAKIGYAAHLNYMIEAGRRLPSMLLASTLYAAAIALILIITVDQTLAVLSAAGWR